MAYKRKSTKKSTYRRRSSAKTRQIAKIARSVVRKETETKFRGNHINETSLNTFTQGYYLDPMNIIEGTSHWNRIGQEITASALHMRGVLTNNGTNENYVRIMVFWAKTRSDISSTTEFFRANNGGGRDLLTLTGLDPIYFPVNKSLIQMVHNKVFKLGPTGGNGATSSTRMFNHFIRLKNRKIRFEGSNSGAGSVAPRLHVLAFAAEGPDDTGLGQVVELSAMVNFYYKDS